MHLRGLCIAFCAVLAAFAQSASACTLWALSGKDVQGGGTFVAKNRDFTPDTPNFLALVTPESGYKVLSLVSVNPQGKRSIVGGVNEKGLAVVSATVGTLPKQERVARTRAANLQGAARVLLRHCASLAEVEGRPDLLATLTPVFALVADATGMAVLESSGGEWRMWRVQPGSAGVHTNHPLSQDFPEIRSREDAPGSVVRLERMRDLCKALNKPVDFQTFTALSQDQAGGPDQSIFRTGSSSKKPRTLAVVSIALPPGAKAPQMFVRLTNPGQPATERVLDLDSQFWASAPAPGNMFQLLP